MLNIRKIQRLGSSSLIITLPKNWVKRIGLLPGDNVYVIERDNQLVLIPFIAEEPLGPPSLIDVKDKDKEYMKNIIKCLIKNGFKNIVLENNAGFENNFYTDTKKLIEKYKDYNVEMKNSTQIIIKGSLKNIEPGQLLRESMSRVADTIEVLTNQLLGKKETQKPVAIDEEQHVKAIHSIFAYLDSVKGEPLEERRRALPLYINEEAWNTLEALQEELLKIIEEVDTSNLSKEEVEALLKYLKLVENALWETIGGLTNESLKRLIASEKIIKEADKAYNTISIKTGPIWYGRLIGTLSFTLKQLEKIIWNSKCMVETLAMREIEQ